jgi:hypothetical protein
LASQPQNASEAAARVSFLLTGDDARHAPQFLAAIGQALAQSRQRAAMQLPAYRRGETQPAPPQASFDELLSASRASFEAWLKDPQAGQPQYQPAEGISPALDREQRDMLVVLKLSRRLARAADTSSPDRGPPSIAELVAQLRNSESPALATIDADGRLLLSTDRQRMQELLGWDGQRYQWQRSGDQWKLATRLPDGRTLLGTLSDDPQNAARPRAQFEIAVSGSSTARQPDRPAASSSKRS